MLELIFQGFMEWVYGLVLECWQYYSSALLDIMSLDFSYLKTHVPAINDMMQVLLAAGWALLLGNLVFQAIKSMVSGLGFEGEDPKLLFARTFVFAFLLMASPQICALALDTTSKIIAALQIPDAVNVGLVDESVFGAVNAAWLLVIVCGLIIMFKVLGLIIEIAERYVILAMLTITAPLAFAMGGSRSTSEIFTGWARMYGSMCALMAVNVVFFKMLLSVLSTIPSGLDVLPWMVLIFAIVKVAKKADAIVTRIGLNPAITGDNLGVRIPGALTYMVVRSMSSAVTKATGKSTGGSGRGTSPSTPPSGNGGGPRSGGPFGGRNGSAASARGFAHQGADQQSAQQNTQSQSGAAQSGGQQAATAEQSIGTTFSSSSQASFNSTPRDSRKSAVPPGMRRAPSHVKSATARPAGSTPSGDRPGKGVRYPASLTTAQQKFVSHSHDVSGKPSAVQHGTAGMGIGIRPPVGSDTVHSGMAGTLYRDGGDGPAVSKSGTAGTGVGHTTRFTQATAQTIHGGTVSETTQVAKQNAVSITQPHQISGAGAGGQISSSPVGQGAYREPGTTRYSQREKTSVQAKPPQVSGSGQSGTAGTGTSRISERPSGTPRHGRYDAAGSSASTMHSPGVSPVRQESQHAPITATPAVGDAASKIRPGTAGTATVGQTASQVRQSARSQTLRAKSLPAEDTKTSGKHTAIISSATKKSRIIPSSGAPVSKDDTRHTRKKRGSEHGK